MLILNWKWFLLSLIICLGLAAIYLRYTTPTYQYAKLLIKDEDNTRGRNSLQYATNLGTISNSNGIDNEMEILTHTIATQAVRDLKLYVTYKSKGKVKDVLLYRNQPISVDIDPNHLEKTAPIDMEITHDGNRYHVTGTYYDIYHGDKSISGPIAIDKYFSTLPASISLLCWNDKFQF